MSGPLIDITGPGEIELLLRDFYDRAFEDDLLRHVFVDVVHMNLEQHLPVILDFWEKVLFDTGTYNGQAMKVHRRVHRRVPLTEQHFARWLQLWRQSLDARFSGPVAEQADSHARRMASVFLRDLTGAEEPARSLPVVSTTPGAPSR